MMRGLLLGATAIAGTLGGHYTAGLVSSPRAPDQAPQEQLEIIKLEPISAPGVRDGKVVGYVIARMAVSAPAANAKAQRGLLVAYSGEAIFRAIYEEKSFDFSAMRAVDVSELTRKVVELANKRIGKPIVREAVVESVDFVSQAEIRSRRAE
jgi:hypothetical protein